MSIPRMLTLVEVAGVTRAKVKTVAGWCASGQLKAKRVGGRWLVPESELVRFLGVAEVANDTGVEKEVS